MKALNRELDTRIKQLSQANQELLAARDQALEASSLKSAFVANMSHGLRTPLSGILGMSELILEKDLEPEIRDMAQTINASGEALLSIVNDILDLSKLEDDRLPVERQLFSPATLAQDCLKLIRPAALDKGLAVTLTLAPALPAQVYADATKIRQILLNLLSNAVKFTRNGNIDVIVSVRGNKHAATTLQYSVIDSGMGIASQDRHLLFKPFSRIEKSTRAIKGSGLGLAISKRFAELMNGTIKFESQENLGSRFSLAIPVETPDTDKVSAPAPAGARTPSKPGEGLRNCRILAVEDNGLLSALIMRQLANIGAKADSAMTGTQALEKVRDTEFDIILMDVNLPDMSGYEVTERLRQREDAAGKQIIIAMTAGTMAGDRERALEAGMNDYLAKPVRLTQLRDTLTRWMESKDLPAGSHAPEVCSNEVQRP